MGHRELIGTNFKDEMNVYPNGEAPVVVLEADGRIADIYVFADGFKFDAARR